MTKDVLPDLSKEMAEARREMRRFILTQSEEVRDLYYRTLTLSEHEAIRRTGG